MSKEHRHIFDKEGKQLCCTPQEEKINEKADFKLIQEQGDKACCVVDEKTRDRHFKGDGHYHGVRFKKELDHQQDAEHSDEDGHDHSGEESKSTIQMFLRAIIALLLLLLAIAFDNWIPQAWFQGWIRLAWYVAAYIPVGFPVIKDAFISIGKGEFFQNFF